MSEFRLDHAKLRTLYKDYTESYAEAYKKWGETLYRGALGQIPLSHLFNTIIAHSRGHIHAPKMGVRNVYEQQVPQARPVESTGAMIINHVAYRRVAKQYITEINNLDDQIKFIGAALLKKLELSEVDALDQRIARLIKGATRLSAKVQKLRGTTRPAVKAV